MFGFLSEQREYWKKWIGFSQARQISRSQYFQCDLCFEVKITKNRITKVSEADNGLLFYAELASCDSIGMKREVWTRSARPTSTSMGPKTFLPSFVVVK